MVLVDPLIQAVVSAIEDRDPPVEVALALLCTHVQRPPFSVVELLGDCIGTGPPGGGDIEQEDAERGKSTVHSLSQESKSCWSAVAGRVVQRFTHSGYCHAWRKLEVPQRPALELSTGGLVSCQIDHCHGDVNSDHLVPGGHEVPAENARAAAQIHHRAAPTAGFLKFRDEIVCSPRSEMSEILVVNRGLDSAVERFPHLRILSPLRPKASWAGKERVAVRQTDRHRFERREQPVLPDDPVAIVGPNEYGTGVARCNARPRGKTRNLAHTRGVVRFDSLVPQWWGDR